MAKPTPIRGLGPDSSLGEAARRSLAGRLADVHTHEARLQQGQDPEAVHDLRVATRRLRAALHVFRPLGRMKTLEREVKRFQDALGQVRDLHVQADWLDTAARRHPQLQPGISALRSTHLSDEEARSQRLSFEAQRWSTCTVPLLHARLKDLKDSHRFISRPIRKQLRQRLRRVDKSMAHHAETHDPATAHTLRKELKKLRYEIELLQPARPMPDTALQVIERLQDRLGSLHDADVRLALLEHDATQGPLPERQAARTLLPLVREERDANATQVEHALRHWRSDALPQTLHDTLT
ncbi:CHAD domain-containing protein [Corallococcus sp. H22C18031201]|nr:CHAD domain-containing protein [Corallococcus sp. H22C18031201]